MDIKALTDSLLEGLLPNTLSEVGEASSKSFPFMKEHDDVELEEWGVFGTTVYGFSDKAGHYYNVVLEYEGIELEANFTADESYQPTNSDELFSVMSTVAKILKKDTSEYPKDRIKIIRYTPSPTKTRPGYNEKGAEQRDKLYQAYFKKNFPGATIEKQGIETVVYLEESYQGKRTNNGAPGTLKAKISKLYGGDVTIEKAKKLKNRENATAHDKRQANWFINFHSKNEGLSEIGDASAKTYKFDLYSDSEEERIYGFYTENFLYSVELTTDEDTPNALQIQFYTIDEEDSDIQDYGKVTNSGEMYRVMATVAAIVKKDLKNHPEINTLEFSAAKKTHEVENISRLNLYLKYIKHYFPNAKIEQGRRPQDAKVHLTEVGESNLQPYKWNESSYGGDATGVEFITDKGTEYKVWLVPHGGDLYVEFATVLENERGSRYTSTQTVTNKGELYRIMATVADIIKHYVEHFKAHRIVYSPSKKTGEEFGTQRDKLYKAFITKAVPGVEFEQQEDMVAAVLPNTKIQEEEGKAAPYGSGYKKLEEELTPLIVELTQYMYKQGLSMDPAPSFEFVEDESNAQNPLGRTAFYDPGNQHIVLYITGRHPKDILRSFAHEMIHHAQNLEGRLANMPQTADINEDDHLKEIEREAYETGNMLFRGWENSRVSKMNEITLDIPKFSQPKTFVDGLREALHEITLSKDNAVEIKGDSTEGEFQVGDRTYTYAIVSLPNPYNDSGSFYNIGFTLKGNTTSRPTKNTDPRDYIKILSTMYKIIVDFVEKEKPTYLGIASLDNIGDKNYHTVYANLTDNKFNRIPGYFRKDVNLRFNGPNGPGSIIVLKRKS